MLQYARTPLPASVTSSDLSNNIASCALPVSRFDARPVTCGIHATRKAGNSVPKQLRCRPKVLHLGHGSSRSMDFLENIYKKSGRRVKVGKIFKVLFRPIRRIVSGVMAASLQPLTCHYDHNLNLQAFMTCIIKVDSSRPGWQRGVLVVLRSCKGVRFKMDNDGVVEISGIGDPDRLLKKIGRSRRVKLMWFQFGQCSEYLCMPPTAKTNGPQQPKPVAYGNNNAWLPYDHHMRAGFAHPPPHFFDPFVPY